MKNPSNGCGRLSCWRRTAMALVFGLLATLQSPAQAAPSLPYDWENVRIDGGGFVPGIVFSEIEPNLIYARTDIGGAYRWDETNQKWIPLLDWVGWHNWGYNGVSTLAADPVDPERVYAVLGMYTNAWDPNNAAIARSSDRGDSWELTELPFKAGGNMPGRGMGERLRVDPNDNSTIYYGAEGGNGLWRSTDFGVNWSQVSNFPNPGTYVADASDPNNYLTEIQGVVWVDFDRSSGSFGQGSDDIYVGVADLGTSLYHSTDGGATWAAIPGAPSGLIPHKGVFDHINHALYVAMSDTGGPYDGETGGVFKYDAITGTWTDISPVTAASGDLYFGYSGLTIDRLDPNTLMVGSLNSWWPDLILFRSTDAGATWTRIWDWTSYPSRSKRYTQDISSVPWLSFGLIPQPPEESPKLGWMNEAMAIDPFNRDRFMYGTGATIYGANDLTNWDSGGTITIEPMIEGLEETAVLDLASPPTGIAHLYSALGDIGGFKHTDLGAVPPLMFTSPNLTSTTGIDFAEAANNIWVRVGNADSNHIGVSTSGGNSWWAPQEPGGVTGGGTVALSANGATIVWSPQGTGVHYSTDFGSTWTPSMNVPQGARVESDRINSLYFYAFSDGIFYFSVDGGANFNTSTASGLPTSAKFVLVPTAQGEIWLAGGDENNLPTGLWHSKDGGIIFNKIPSVDSAVNVGLGMAAPGAMSDTLYLAGAVDGVHGVYRSTDEGLTWFRINDDEHQYGNMGEAIIGDPRVFGRVFLGTNGRGILVAEPSPGGPVNNDPVAVANASVTSGTAPLAVSFDGLASTDADGDPLTYSWSFGDGNGANGASVSHTYTTAGTYTVTLTVDDGQGGIDVDSLAITVTAVGGGNTDPVAAISATPLSGTAPLLVNFDASGSTDADGDPLLHTWNFGDGSSATGSQFAHVYTSPGTYTAEVTVTDFNGGSDTASVLITVDAGGGGNNDCEVNYQVTNQWTGGFQVDLSITNNSASAISGYTLEWDVGPGESFSSGWNATFSSSGSSVSASNAAGNWNGVINPNGGTVSFGLQISRGSAAPYIPTTFVLNGEECGGDGGGQTPGNTAPTADASASTSSGTAPLAVSFDGSGSTDADGDALSYSWDFGDGSSASGATASHTYATAGTYTATLTVSDGQDSDSDSITISIDSASGGGDIACDYSVSNDWGSGFIAEVTVSNNGGSTINAWQVTLDYSGSTSIVSGWGGVFALGDPNIITPMPYNSVIQPGGAISFGFQGTRDSSEPPETPTMTCVITAP